MGQKCHAAQHSTTQGPTSRVRSHRCENALQRDANESKEEMLTVTKGRLMYSQNERTTNNSTFAFLIFWTHEASH